MFTFSRSHKFIIKTVKPKRGFRNLARSLFVKVCREIMCKYVV